MAKLSPKDFYSITYWMKQFIIDSSEPKYSINIIQHINATITCDKTMAEEGETITCTITPNEGYQVDKFLVNGVESELTFTMPAEDITISAEVSYIIYGTLNAPTLEIISNDSTQLIYSIKNSNTVDCLFNGETVSGSGALELTHIWSESEESFLIEGYFSADHYLNSEELIETVDKPEASLGTLLGYIGSDSSGNKESTPNIWYDGYIKIWNIKKNLSDGVELVSFTPGSNFKADLNRYVYSYKYYSYPQYKYYNVGTIISPYSNTIDLTGDHIYLLNLGSAYSYTSNGSTRISESIYYFGTYPKTETLNLYIRLQGTLTYTKNGETLTKEIDQEINWDGQQWGMNGQKLQINVVFPYPVKITL